MPAANLNLRTLIAQKIAQPGTTRRRPQPVQPDPFTRLWTSEGWQLERTGGGCTALTKRAGHGRVWVITTDGDAQAPTRPTERSLLCQYLRSVWYGGESRTDDYVAPLRGPAASLMLLLSRKQEGK